MAKDKGVPVIKLKAAALRSQLLDHIDMEGNRGPENIRKLEALAAEVLPALKKGVKKVSTEEVIKYEEVAFEA